MFKLLPLLLLALPIPSVFGQCQNVIGVKDLLPDGALHFRDVQLRTFDAGKGPACDGIDKAAIHLPGWLQLHSGEVFIRELPALRNASRLELALTLEQDSFWVGQICDRGSSQSAFLTDDFCSLPLCEVLPTACQALTKAQPGQQLPLSEFFPADGWLPLEPAFNPMVEGHWKAEAELLLYEPAKDSVVLARVGVEGWHFVRAGEHQEL